MILQSYPWQLMALWMVITIAFIAQNTLREHAEKKEVFKAFLVLGWMLLGIASILFAYYQVTVVG